MLPSHAAFHRVLLQFCEGVAPNAGKLLPASEMQPPQRWHDPDQCRLAPLP